MTRADAKKMQKRRVKKRFIKDMLRMVEVHNPGSYLPPHKRQWQRHVIKLANDTARS